MGAVHESNAIYLTIANGKLSRRMRQPTEKSIERVTEGGKTVHEEFYKGWTGRITNIYVKEHPEFGKFWNVVLTDEDGDAVIQMNYSSGYSAAFLKTLPNVNLDQEITFSPFMKIEGDKKKTTVFISQNNQPLKHFYTRDNPNDLPQLVKGRFKGQDVWDDTDMMEFLEKMVNNEILPKLKKVQPAPTANKTVVPEPITDIPDDLPF